MKPLQLLVSNTDTDMMAKQVLICERTSATFEYYENMPDRMRYTDVPKGE